MGASSELDEDAILELLEAMHADATSDPHEGLRERKKRRLRQRISNVATAMFLTQGFDNVTVARIAASCEVSEQTVYNYFPTKESMLLDRSESMTIAMADAVRERSALSLVDAVVGALHGAGLHGGGPRGDIDEARQLDLIRRFTSVAVGSPALAPARLADLARFTDQVAVALAQRIGADRFDPEVIIATRLVAGLTEVRQQSSYRQVQLVNSLAALEDAVRNDLQRAAALAEPTLTSFDNVKKGSSTRTRAARNLDDHPSSTRTTRQIRDRK